MIKRIWTSLIFLLILTPSAIAQLYTTGTEPGSMKWKQINTDNYRVLYPEGLDSLARVYATKLEQYRTITGETCGYLANEAYSSKMPVLLHPYSSSSNGLVVWTPRRMELMTIPCSYDADPMSWETLLSVHEGRHVSQMQYTNSGKFKFLSYLTGELAAGGLAAIYCGGAFFEGDAVKTETDLLYGRGKTADFLNYYKAAFAEGDTRDFFQWRWGSQKYYTPDYYRAGYLFYAGMEDMYGVTDFAKRYFNKLMNEEKLFLPFGVINKTTKDISGKKFRHTFLDITQFYKEKWEKENEARGPFMPSEMVSDSSRFYSAYNRLFLAGDQLHYTQSSLTSNTTFDGRPFKANASQIAYSEYKGKMFWSEIVPDKRWEQIQYSIIRSMVPGEKEVHNISSESRYFNPSIAKEGELLAVTNYPSEGGSSIEVIDPDTGENYLSFIAPDGLQIVESAWIGNDIFVSGVSDKGIGIYLANEEYITILEPSQSKIQHLWSDGDCLYFTADRTSVNELYELNPLTGSVRQMTLTEFGADDFVPYDDYLYYSSVTRSGKYIFRTKTSDLPIEEVDFFDYYAPTELVDVKDIPVKISEVEDYSRIKHAFKFHSWMPLYVNYDEISSISKENVWSLAGLGATALFQNDLGTLYGSAGIGLYPWMSGFAHITYRGLYPVFDAEVNLGKGMNNALLQAYVPLNFSSGGWSRGVIPRVYGKWNEGYGFSAGASVRAYSVLPVANSRIYPEWGVGGEIGAIMGTNRVYGSFYGYLPGIMPEHGVRLAAQVQWWNPVEKHAVGTFDVKYALPLLALDWSGMSPVAYLRNFELIVDGLVDTNGRMRVGADFMARLENFIWLPYTTRIGVSMSYSTKFNVGLIFNIDI